MVNMLQVKGRLQISLLMLSELKWINNLYPPWNYYEIKRFFMISREIVVN